MATLLKNIPNNITEYPNSFKRQGAFPLERYSVFPSYQEAKTYAETSKIAYVTQPIGVAYKIGEEVVADYYIIGDENGTLIHIGNSNHNLDEINARIEEIEKFFILEDGESLKDTLDELIELQKWIEEHLGDFDEFKEQVRVDFETEVKNRMEEDKYLSEAISAESARAAEAEEALHTATLQNANVINNEQALREEADAGLSVIINTEKSDRQKQYTELQNALNEEVGRAIEEERKISQALNGAVTQLNGTIDARCALEATKRANAIDKLESDITEKLNTEIRNRGESDDLLQNKIEEEIVAREEEAESLRAALAEESSIARNAESSLRQQINNSNAEIYTILAADRERSISVDNELNAALEAETERANQADAELYLALEAETVRANKADQELYAAIKAEEERSRAEEAALGEMLDKEANILHNLIGEDDEKTVRQIANEELAEQLLSDNADASFKTLQDLAKWIEDHPEDVAAINTAIALNTENIAKEENRAKEAESSLESALNAEVQLREAQINGINFSTKEEVNRALAAEKAISLNVEALENNLAEAIADNTKFIENHTHDVVYTPKGSITQPTFTGEKATISMSDIPEGDIDKANFTGTEATISVVGTPTGSVAQPTFSGEEVTISVTGMPSGTVSQPTFSGSELTSTGNYTPEGTIGDLTITVTPTEETIAHKTQDGQLPSFYAAYDTEKKKIKFIFNAGASPTYGNISVMTAVDVAVSTPQFSGTAATITVTGTPEGTVSQSTFTGDELTSTGVYTPVGTVSKPEFTGDELTSTGSYTPEGTINDLAFTGKELNLSTEYTPAGTINELIFTGTEETVIAKPNKEEVNNG